MAQCSPTDRNIFARDYVDYNWGDLLDILIEIMPQWQFDLMLNKIKRKNTNE
jgi:hypothetical protein